MKELGVTKKPKDEYEKLKEAALLVVRKYYKRAAALRDPEWKTEFGDLDLLVSGPTFSPNAPPWLDPAFASRGHIVNGHVTSFEFQDFQVDLIEVAEDGWELALAAFYATVGAYLGAIARRGGLKLGWERLSLRFFTIEGETEMGLSKDPRAIWAYFGLDWTIFERGFRTEEEVYAYCLSQTRVDRCLLSNTAAKSLEKKNKLARSRIGPFLAVMDTLPAKPRRADEKELSKLHREAAAYFGKEVELDMFLVELEEREARRCEAKAGRSEAEAARETKRAQIEKEVAIFEACVRTNAAKDRRLAMAAMNRVSKNQGVPLEGMGKLLAGFCRLERSKDLLEEQLIDGLSKQTGGGVGEVQANVPATGIGRPPFPASRRWPLGLRPLKVFRRPAKGGGIGALTAGKCMPFHTTRVLHRCAFHRSLAHCHIC